MPPLFHPGGSTADLTRPIENIKRTLRNKSVLVTGGASGFGAAMVKDFAEAGAYVTIVDLNAEAGEAAAKAYAENRQHVQFIPTDVRSHAAQLAAFKAALSFSLHGTVDIVVASAGLGGGAFITSASAPSLDEDPPAPSTAAIDVNLTGVFYTASLALYYFRVPPRTETAATNGSMPSTTGAHAEKADKSLVFISSLAGYIDLPWATAYNAAKFGVRGLWRSLRGGVAELSPQQEIRVNLIAPWFVKTPMTTAITAKIDALGYEWATVEGVVDGVVRCAADAGIRGRAIAILPGGNVDLGDDAEGWEGGEALKKVMGFARGRGDGEGEKFEIGGGGIRQGEK